MATTSDPHHMPSHESCDHQGDIHFYPPLYRQRYEFALNLISNNSNLHSLLDIGCGTCRLLTIGKYRNPHIQLAAAIDINRFELDQATFYLRPFPVEYAVFRRETPLCMYLLHGDATHRCPCFHGFDVITLIEVIEHLYPKDLNNLVEHVFAHIRPRVVIVTTPNADFNVLFPLMSEGQFRHADHKFEFTRKQFRHWTESIEHRFYYRAEFHGLGDAPVHEQYRNVGYCTQIAVFYRLNQEITSNLTSDEFSWRLSKCNRHEIINFIDYPFGKPKTVDVKEQVRYILEMYRMAAAHRAHLGEGEHDPDDHRDDLGLNVSLETVLKHPRLLQLNITSEQLKEILHAEGYRIHDNNQISLPESHPSTDHICKNDHDESVSDEHKSSQLYSRFTPLEESWD